MRSLFLSLKHTNSKLRTLEHCPGHVGGSGLVSLTELTLNSIQILSLTKAPDKVFNSTKWNFSSLRRQAIQENSFGFCGLPHLFFTLALQQDFALTILKPRQQMLKPQQHKASPLGFTFLWKQRHHFYRLISQSGKLLRFHSLSECPPPSVMSLNPASALTCVTPRSSLSPNTHSWWVSLPALCALGKKVIMLYHSCYHLLSSHLHKPVTSEIKTFACTWVELVGWKRNWRGKWFEKQSQKQVSRICIFGFPFNSAISSSPPLLPIKEKKFQPAKSICLTFPHNLQQMGLL